MSPPSSSLFFFLFSFIPPPLFLSLLFFFLCARNSKKATLKKSRTTTTTATRGRRNPSHGRWQCQGSQQLDLTIISTAFFGIQFPPDTQGKTANAPRALSSFRILVLLIYFCLSMLLACPERATRPTGLFLNCFRRQRGDSIKRTNNSDRAAHDSFIHHGKWRDKKPQEKLTFLAVVVVPTKSATISTGWTTILTFRTFAGSFITL
jgi:hypothetical protein